MGAKELDLHYLLKCRRNAPLNEGSLFVVHPQPKRVSFFIYDIKKRYALTKEDDYILTLQLFSVLKTTLSIADHSLKSHQQALFDTHGWDVGSPLIAPSGFGAFSLGTIIL